MTVRRPSEWRDQSRFLVRDDSAAHRLAQRRKAQQILLERGALPNGLRMHPETLGAVMLEREKPEDAPSLDGPQDHRQMTQVLVPLVAHPVVVAQLGIELPRVRFEVGDGTGHGDLLGIVEERPVLSGLFEPLLHRTGVRGERLALTRLVTQRGELGERLLADGLDAIRPQRRGRKGMLLELHHLFHHRAVFGWNFRHEKLPALVLALLESGFFYRLAEVTDRAGAFARRTRGEWPRGRSHRGIRHEA